MNINQVSIFLENRPGQLSAICRALVRADVSIVTLSLADTADFGIVRMIVSDHEKARQALVADGHAVNVSEVLAVTVPDRVGGMSEIMEIVGRADVNVEYAYAFAFHHGEKAVLVFRFDDNAKAAQALEAAGVITLNERQIEQSAK